MKRNNILKLFILVMMSTGCALQTSTSSNDLSSKKESSSLPIQLSSTTSTSSNNDSMQSSTPLDTSYEEQSTIINSSIVESTSSEESSSVNVIVSNHYKGDYYNEIDFTLVDSAMKTELRELVTKTHTTVIKYNSLNNILYKTDRSLSDSSKVTLFYSHKDVNGTWDQGNTYNKEHVWPQSTGWSKETTAGADVHHLRPADPTVNSTRGNLPFGEVNGGKEAKLKNGEGSNCYYANGYFEPQDAVKGDVARIIFYLLTRYSDADNKSITGVAKSMDMLLEWNELDPVDELEMQRNKEGQSQQGNRNPFIDYPELADFIWG